MTFRKRLLAAALLPLVLAACGDGAEGDSARQVPASVPKLAVTYSNVAEWKDVAGEVATVDQSQALARIPGILTTFTVREGDFVTKGQPIGRIVDTQLAYQAGAHGAQAAAAQAQAAQAQAELERVRFLYRNGVYAKARLDQAEAAARAANAQIAAARAQQQAVNAVSGQGVVTAPTTGRVIRADVPAGSPVSPGMSLATITAGPTILRLELPESLSASVRVGSRVRAALPGRGEVTGSIAKIYPSVQAGQITADVNVPGLDGALIGRRIAARVETGSRRAIVIPTLYVRTEYGIDQVRVVDANGRVSDVPVQTAPTDDAARVEILSGLSAGDRLVKAAAR